MANRADKDSMEGPGAAEDSMDNDYPDEEFNERKDLLFISFKYNCVLFRLMRIFLL